MEEALFNRIRNYDLKQVSDWTDLEEFLFKSVASWFAEWMARYTGAPNMAISTLPANEVKAAVEEIEEKLPDSAASKVEEKGENFKDGKLWSKKITKDVPHFTINNFKDYITTIYRIGMEQEAESQPYIIEFSNKTRMFLSMYNHYAYPLEKMGSSKYEPFDLTNYKHSYDSLIEDAKKNIDLTSVIHFLRGDISGIKDKDNLIHLLTILTANYICENNRNWLQLLLSIIQLGKKQLLSFKALEENQFPMGGGSWTNHWCWGPSTVRRSNTGENDGNNTKRFCLKVLIELTYNEDSDKSKTFWVNWIGNLNGEIAKVRGTSVPISLWKPAVDSKSILGRIFAQTKDYVQNFP